MSALETIMPTPLQSFFSRPQNISSQTCTNQYSHKTEWDPSSGPQNPSSVKQTWSLVLGSTNSSHLGFSKPWSGFLELWSSMCYLGSLHKEMWKPPPSSNLVQSYGWTCLFPFTHESQFCIVVQHLQLLYFIQFSSCGQTGTYIRHTYNTVIQVTFVLRYHIGRKNKRKKPLNQERKFFWADWESLELTILFLS